MDFEFLSVQTKHNTTRYTLIQHSIQIIFFKIQNFERNSKNNHDLASTT